MQSILSRSKQILFLAAFGNILGTLVALISPAFFNSQLFKYPPDRATTFPFLAMYHYCFWGVGLIMGIAYWMAALNPKKHQIVFLIGGLGKLLLVSFLLMLYILGYGKWLMITGVIWDGPLGLLLLLMYWNVGKLEEIKKV